jgi:hypothetical protein
MRLIVRFHRQRTFPLRIVPMPAVRVSLHPCSLTEIVCEDRESHVSRSDDNAFRVNGDWKDFCQHESHPLSLPLVVSPTTRTVIAKDGTSAHRRRMTHPTASPSRFVAGDCGVDMCTNAESAGRASRQCQSRN